MSNSELPQPLTDKVVIGVAEKIDLPELGLTAIATRIDTGAKTSALHVDHIEIDETAKKVKFWFHPDFHDVEKTIKCAAPLHDVRWIKSSNGEKERRCVIKTPAQLGNLTWDIELTLTDRSIMKHLMLLGREALEQHFVIDPSDDYLAAK
ncbi:ATP-dependent zinc protease family protein [Planctobacterium marinum]|uniref:ATP-dependent zinc protease family protein n=1 Tax=Planctobacterium marinum TaxID=1631968 RepID=UPI001E352881|nr:RimK/LysX family protein [Planctobacterium marinum]MCC2607498.1 RimK/LysX family protein [Planctobacterium marinum]